MVHYTVFFTLFLAAVALAHDGHRSPKRATVTVFKTETEIRYSTVIKTKTLDSCHTPGYPNPGPTSVVKPDVKPTTIPKYPPQSTQSPPPPIQSPPQPTQSLPKPTQSLLPNSVKPPASPAPSPTPAGGDPDDDDEEDCEDDDDDDDDISSSLPGSSSVKPLPSPSGSPTKPNTIPPATLIAIPSSSVASPASSNTVAGLPSSKPVPVPPSSVVSSPASSVVSPTGAPKPASTGKYDRNAICGNQKREPSPFEVAPQFSKRDLRRRITY